MRIGVTQLLFQEQGPALAHELDRLALVVAVGHHGAVRPEERDGELGAPVVAGVLPIANDKLSLAIEVQGGAFHRLHLLSDDKKQTPLSSTHGHFLCADAFGPSSLEERAAGLSSHGEANKQPWKLDGKSKEGNVTILQTSATLPIAGERFTRKLRLVEWHFVCHCCGARQQPCANQKHA